MPSLDIEQLVQQMTDAASRALNTNWPEARRLAEPAFEKLGDTVLLIASEYDAGEISQREAQGILDMQRVGLRSLLRSIAGVGAPAAERAADAALDAAKPLINSAVGFALL